MFDERRRQGAPEVPVGDGVAAEVSLPLGEN